jgi:hypothetical protein
MDNYCCGRVGCGVRAQVVAESEDPNIVIIRHLWANRMLSNLGYDSLTEEQQRAFNRIVCKPVSDRCV